MLSAQEQQYAAEAAKQISADKDKAFRGALKNYGMGNMAHAIGTLAALKQIFEHQLADESYKDVISDPTLTAADKAAGFALFKEIQKLLSKSC